MKILFYTPVKLVSGGGCERWHCDVTNSLKKQFRFNVEIVSGNLGEEHWPEKYLKAQLQGINYLQLDYLILFGILIPTPAVFLTLLRKFKQADVVHFIHGFAGQDILMFVLKLLTGKKIVVGHHAPIFYSNKFHNYYMKFVSRHLLNLFDAHQTLNRQDKEFFEKKWNIKNVHFIPSGVRVEKFLKVKRVKHSGLVFVSVGRYSIQKGFDLALKAIVKFNAKLKNNQAKFFFAGGGGLKSLIQSYAKIHKNIIDLGYLKYEQLPRLYAKSDIYFLPSREEPFGLVLIEAWSCGIPVLATKTEGPKDMLQPNMSGWFIKSIDVEEIYKSISTLYEKYKENPLFFKSLDKSCRSVGIQYSIDASAKGMKRNFFTSD